MATETIRSNARRTPPSRLDQLELLSAAGWHGRDGRQFHLPPSQAAKETLHRLLGASLWPLSAFYAKRQTQGTTSAFTLSAKAARTFGSLDEVPRLLGYWGPHRTRGAESSKST